MSFDALNFLRDYNIQLWTEGNNCQAGWVNIKCPACTDKSNHGAFSLSKNKYNCWKCGFHYIDKIIGLLTGLSFYKVKEIIKKYQTEEIYIPKKSEESNIKNIDLIGGELTNHHKKYLKNRGFNPNKLVEKYGILGTGPEAGKGWKFRIIIPIFHLGKLIAYQGRDITGKSDQRYKSLSPKKSVMNYKHTLYGLEFCKNNYIGVTEGIMDIWKLGDDFVCSFGTAITEYQIKLLSGFEKIFFLFDPEPEAQEKAEKAANKLASLGKEVFLIDNEKDYDPGEYNKREVSLIRKELGFEVS